MHVGDLVTACKSWYYMLATTERMTTMVNQDTGKLLVISFKGKVSATIADAVSRIDDIPPGTPWGFVTGLSQASILEPPERCLRIGSSLRDESGWCDAKACTALAYSAAQDQLDRFRQKKPRTQGVVLMPIYVGQGDYRVFAFRGPELDLCDQVIELALVPLEQLYSGS